MVNLDLIVFESDPDRSCAISPAIFRQLLTMATGGPAMPVVPTSLLSTEFKLITYPPMVLNVVKCLDAVGVYFKQGYGIVADKLLEIAPAPDEWYEMARLLKNDKLAGWWLVWGLDWLVLDNDDLYSYIEGSDELLRWVRECEREYVVRSLINLQDLA